MHAYVRSRPWRSLRLWRPVRSRPDKAKAVLDCTHAEAVWKKAVAAIPALLDFYGPQHDATAEEFRALEAKRRSTTVDIILGRHAANMPRGTLAP